MTTVDANLHTLLSAKQYTEAISYIKTKPIETALDADKRDCNLSLMYYLLGNYEQAKEVVSAALSAAEEEGRIADVWPRLYYRLAKAYEGLQDYDAMCSAYDKMYETLPEEDRNKQLKHMQDYYNKDVVYMKRWITNHGGYCEGLDFEYYDIDYRGVVSNKLIKHNEIAVKIPRVCLMYVESCKLNNPYLELLFQENEYKSLDQHIFVVLKILHEKHTNGFYMPYIRCFPKLYNNVMYNFNKEEVKMLKGSYTLIQVLTKIIMFIETYRSFLKKTKAVPFTFEEYVWANMVVSSRAFGIKVDSKFTTCMVPISDMINHASAPNTTWGYNQYSNEFQMTATSDIARGDIIYDSYGNRSNHTLLFIYGFTLPNNVYDESYLISNPVLMALHSKYIDNLIKSSTNSSKLLDHFTRVLYTIDIRYTQILVKRSGLFKVGYLYNEQNRHLFKYMRGPDVPKSRRSEINMLNNILFLVKHALDAFPLSRQEYADILNNNTITFNMRNIATLCIGEIDVLEFWKVMCEQIIEILSEPAPTQILKTLCERLIKYPYIVTFKPYIDLLENLPLDIP
jgi:tetratricopeptide (TPR) repeat protein